MKKHLINIDTNMKDRSKYWLDMVDILDEQFPKVDLMEYIKLINLDNKNHD